MDLFIETTKQEIEKTTKRIQDLRLFLHDRDEPTGIRFIPHDSEIKGIVNVFVDRSRMRKMYETVQASVLAKLMKQFIEIVLAHCNEIVNHYRMDLLNRWDNAHWRVSINNDINQWTDMYVRRLLLHKWTRQFDNDWNPQLQRAFERQCKRYDSQEDTKHFTPIFETLVQESMIHGFYRILLKVGLSAKLHLNLETIGKKVTARIGKQSFWGPEISGTCATIILPPIIYERKFCKTRALVIADSFDTSIVEACDPSMSVDNHPDFLKNPPPDDEESKPIKKNQKYPLTVDKLVELCRANTESK